MKLRQTFEKTINGYWDGGPKRVFDWSIDKYHGGKDSKGSFIRIGSWPANHWFCVSQGRTDKLTLSYAKRRLAATAKRAGLKCTFEYIKD